MIATGSTRNAAVVGLLGVVCLCRCDDPSTTHNVGGLVLVIRSVPTASDKFGTIAEVSVEYDRVEVLHQSPGSSDEKALVVDTQRRVVVLRNTSEDTVVAQYPVPIGTVSQLRIFPVAVTLKLRTGELVSLDPQTSDLPSWKHSGWKFVAREGTSFPVRLDEQTGIRGTLDFENRFVRPGGSRWKMKPTIPSELFQVNPPPGQPGVFLDSLTVVFREGTSASRVAAINAQIRATVLLTPVIGTWYRVKLPGTTNPVDASRYYLDQPEVSGVMPAINFGEYASPADNPNTTLTDLIGMAEAWDTAAVGGTIGRSTVIAAIIDGNNFALANVDLYRNFWVNQGELPVALFDSNDSGTIDPAEIARHDIDPPGSPDGLITIRDLENEDAGIRPMDINNNGRVDGFDLVHDPRWANGINEDQNGITSTNNAGFVDDLVGWDFTQNDNDPSSMADLGGGSGELLIPPANHGTDTAAVMMAEGNNDAGMAGIVWRTSVMAVRASAGDTTKDGGIVSMPAELFAEAVKYVDSFNGKARVQVVNVSQGWSFTRKGHALRCGDNEQTTGPIAPDAWTAALAQADAKYSELFVPTRALFVFAAGNDGHFMDDASVTNLPQMPVFRAIPARTILVGNAKDGTSNARDSHYGSPVELWAPGTGWSLPSSPGMRLSGTSYAAPAVSGAALLLASHKSGFASDAPALKRALLSTATPTITVRCEAQGSQEMPNQRMLNVRELLGAVP